MAKLTRGNKSGIQGTVIAVDTLSDSILFCTPSEDGERIETVSANFRSKAFDQEFFDRFARVIKQQMEKNPQMDLQRATVVLPDRLFMTDMITIPMIHRRAMQQSLSLAIEAIYNNAADLSLMTYAVQQTKQNATFGLVGIRRDILDKVRKAFADNGVTVGTVTYASNAMADGAMALNSKLRNDTYMLLDIKEDYSRLAFVVRGTTMGYYDLPFGHGALYKTRQAAEDLLFDHRAGELLVLNAKERARAKQLTMEGAAPVEQGEDGSENTTNDPVYENISDGSRRSTRKLPKFMQRPTPQSREEYLYENFRIFVKWALDLITNNREIVSLDKLTTVYVNMPEEYDILYTLVNQETDEHGVTFAPMITEAADATVMENLELYGGFFASRYNSANNF